MPPVMHPVFLEACATGGFDLSVLAGQLEGFQNLLEQG